ncbi:hypothetical protein P154DRAFT_577365 [Amniculicola lignicola CBS 123094]|uniref:Uncharacterized protein n=1 Tax=Amniculicola lignicola CBS 123094 TaxID=1392246 RepID=A0A6A5WAN6_9PLEO|nr:hypothetical protein P154DRAFT_577365 [Amniculicola lignicola CBS 123094]
MSSPFCPTPPLHLTLYPTLGHVGFVQCTPFKTKSTIPYPISHGNKAPSLGADRNDSIFSSSTADTFSRTNTSRGVQSETVTISTTSSTHAGAGTVGRGEMSAASPETGHRPQDHKRNPSRPDSNATYRRSQTTLNGHAHNFHHAAHAGFPTISQLRKDEVVTAVEDVVEARDVLLGSRVGLRTRRRKLKVLHDQTVGSNGALFTLIRQLHESKAISFTPEIEEAYQHQIAMGDRLGAAEVEYEQAEARYNGLELKYTQKEEELMEIVRSIVPSSDEQKTVKESKNMGRDHGASQELVETKALTSFAFGSAGNWDGAIKTEISEQDLQAPPKAIGKEPHPSRSTPKLGAPHSTPPLVSNRSAVFATAPSSRHASYMYSNHQRMTLPDALPQTRLTWYDTHRRVEQWLLEVVRSSSLQKLRLKHDLSSYPLDDATWWQILEDHWDSGSIGSPPPEADNEDLPTSLGSGEANITSSPVSALRHIPQSNKSTSRPISTLHLAQTELPIPDPSSFQISAPSNMLLPGSLEIPVLDRPEVPLQGFQKCPMPDLSHLSMSDSPKPHMPDVLEPAVTNFAETPILNPPELPVSVPMESPVLDPSQFSMQIPEAIPPDAVPLLTLESLPIPDFEILSSESTGQAQPLDMPPADIVLGPNDLNALSNDNLELGILTTAHMEPKLEYGDTTIRPGYNLISQDSNKSFHPESREDNHEGPTSAPRAGNFGHPMHRDRSCSNAVLSTSHVSPPRLGCPSSGPEVIIPPIPEDQYSLAGGSPATHIRPDSPESQPGNEAETRNRTFPCVPPDDRPLSPPTTGGTRTPSPSSTNVEGDFWRGSPPRHRSPFSANQVQTSLSAISRHAYIPGI